MNLFMSNNINFSKSLLSENAMFRYKSVVTNTTPLEILPKFRNVELRKSSKYFKYFTKSSKQVILFLKSPEFEITYWKNPHISLL